MLEIAVELDDLDGTPLDLQWLEPDKLAKTLGILMPPAQTGKHNLWLCKGKQKHGRTRSNLASFTTMMSFLSYAPQSRRLWSTQWRSPSSLNRSGNRCYPQCLVRHFPRPVSAATFLVLWSTPLQLKKHLDMLLCHPANKSKTGAFLKAVLQAHQLEPVPPMVSSNKSMAIPPSPSTWRLVLPPSNKCAKGTKC
ncbi:unnamed protein product [Cylindrotheca closterium]|uniref:Uncharacterized protein n=1 Tax=Cylindrotheca closterium TaxID=2856 RepID=A0AAD2CSS8_9STRA|nr:unnamed protein product [Cylindrotheca closterium]